MSTLRAHGRKLQCRASTFLVSQIARQRTKPSDTADGGGVIMIIRHRLPVGAFCPFVLDRLSDALEQIDFALLGSPGITTKSEIFESCHR
jgi:hypothetical protein